MKRSLAVAVVSVLVVAGIAYFFFDRAVIAIASGVFNVDISYRSLERPWINRYDFYDLRVSPRPGGTGIIAKEARITISAERDSICGLGVSFELLDVRFEGRTELEDGTYDTLEGLVSVPLGSDWLYSEIFGTVVPVKNGISIKGLTAHSRDVRIKFDGLIGKDKTIESDTVIYFSDALKSKAPKELTDVVLSTEKDGWYSLSVHLSGDYNAPSVNVSSKLFRLNIRNVIK
jgi:hypothetical protein